MGRHWVPTGRRWLPVGRQWLWVAGGLALLIVVVVGFALGGGPAPAPAATTASAPVKADVITFEVTGAGVDQATRVTYVKDTYFGTQQETAVALPWSAQIEMKAGPISTQPLSVTAESSSGGPGSISCRILRNGAEVTTNTATGPYAVVACAGGLQ